MEKITRMGVIKGAFNYYDLSKYISAEEIEKLAGEVDQMLEQKKNYYKVLDFVYEKLTEVKGDIEKKYCKKMVNDIFINMGFADEVNEFIENPILKDKIGVDFYDAILTLHVHDGFVVKSNMGAGKTYINDKFFYDIEEQDLLECYCEFVTDDKTLYVQFLKKKILGLIFLEPYMSYFKTYRKKAGRVEKLKEKKNVEMIFDSKEILYKK